MILTLVDVLSYNVFFYQEPKTEEPIVKQNNYKVLVENEKLKVEYETIATNQHNKMITINCLFTNKTDETFDQLKFNITDTLNTKFVELLFIFSKNGIIGKL